MPINANNEQTWFIVALKYQRRTMNGVEETGIKQKGILTKFKYFAKYFLGEILVIIYSMIKNCKVKVGNYYNIYNCITKIFIL